MHFGMETVLIANLDAYESGNCLVFLQEVLMRMILFCKAAVEVTFQLPVQANWLFGRDGQTEMLSVMYPAPSHHVS